ncbi:sugar ABC transporter permease [bacterium]|nr:sugar ABC transporter permease [bacterium]
MSKTNIQKKSSKRDLSSNAFRETMAAYGFLLPNFLGFAIFTAIPVVVSLFMAFTYWNIFSKPIWIGLDNFRSLLWFRHDGGHLVPNDPFFWQYLYNTVFLMMGIPLGMAGSLILALMLNQKIKGVVFFRTVYFLPSVSAGVALLILWKYIFNSEVGLLNQCIRSAGAVIYASKPLAMLFTIFCAAVFGLIIIGIIASVLSFLSWICEKLKFYWPEWLYRILVILSSAAVYIIIAAYGRSFFVTMSNFMGDPPNWLGMVSWAKPSLMFMGFWGSIGGFNAILYLAALQGVPRSMYEAAEIDGASGWKKFWSVTWPMISPTTFYIMIMGVIAGMQSGFMQAKIMTGGGPVGSTTTLEYYLYKTAFENFNMGYASAISWFIFIVVLMLTLITWKLGGQLVSYE